MLGTLDAYGRSVRGTLTIRVRFPIVVMVRVPLTDPLLVAQCTWKCNGVHVTLVLLR